MHILTLTFCLIILNISTSHASNKNLGVQVINDYVKGVEKVCYNAGVKVKNRKRVINATKLVTKEWLNESGIGNEMINEFAVMMGDKCLKSYNKGLSVE